MKTRDSKHRPRRTLIIINTNIRHFLLFEKKRLIDIIISWMTGITQVTSKQYISKPFSRERKGSEKKLVEVSSQGN